MSSFLFIKGAAQLLALYFSIISFILGSERWAKREKTAAVMECVLVQKTIDFPVPTRVD